MKSYSSREVLKLLKEDGWYEVNVVGSHHQFKHPIKKGVSQLNILTKTFLVKPLIVLKDSLGLPSGSPAQKYWRYQNETK